MNECCENCRYWVNEKDCRRFPPTIIANPAAVLGDDYTDDPLEGLLAVGHSERMVW